MTNELGDQRRSWRDLYAGALTFLSPGLLSGAVCGGLIGGVGGRLAMLILRLTSDDSLHGMKTDDDFTIGSFTGETVFLLLLTTFAGTLGGVLYVGVREWLPERWRPILFGLLGATVGGTLVIRPHGIDFTLLEPLSLAVAMFVVIPAVYGVALSLLAERFVHSPGLQRSRWRWAAAAAVVLSVLPAGPFGLVFLLLLGLVIALNRSGDVARLWRSAPITWAGRGTFAFVLALSSVFLVIDVLEVL
jgi:hypothetical protein